MDIAVLDEKAIDRKMKALILGIEDSYTEDARAFVRFLQDENLALDYEGLKRYAEYLETPHEGKVYSASTYNKRISGAKNRIRYLAALSPEFENITRQWKLNKALGEIKSKKVQCEIRKDKLLTASEIEILISKSSEKLGLFIEFLAHTGLRIGALTAIRISDIEEVSGEEYFRIRVLGKGRKERFIKVSRELVGRVKAHFQGKELLFETSTHHQYCTRYISTEIHRAGKRINRNVSAHTFRHTFATRKIALSKDIGAVSRYLGHSSSSITLDMYNHSVLDFSKHLREF